MNPPDISAVPSEFVKWFILMTVFAAFVIGGVIYFVRSNKKQVREIGPQPLKVEVKPRRFSQDTCDARHSEITRRLDGHDAELNRIWTEMRAEDTSIRETHAANMADMKTELGVLKGTLNQIDANVRLLVDAKVSRG